MIRLGLDDEKTRGALDFSPTVVKKLEKVQFSRACDL